MLILFSLNKQMILEILNEVSRLYCRFWWNSGISKLKKICAPYLLENQMLFIKVYERTMIYIYKSVQPINVSVYI